MSIISIQAQSSTETAILTSTKIQPTNTKTSTYNDRRKAILPTPHRPKLSHNLLTKSTNKETSSKEKNVTLKENCNKSCDKEGEHEFDSNTCERFLHDHKVFVDTDSGDHVGNLLARRNIARQKTLVEVDRFEHSSNQQGNYKKMGTVNRSNRNPNVDDNSESQSQSEGEKNDEDFDEFILRNFIPFTGKQNVIQWLDETETKFNRFHIVRNLRYTAIPLLVESEARYKYIKHRKDIRSFDDLYDFLLLHYDIENHTSISLKSCQATDSKSSEVCTSCHTKFSNESHSSIVKENNTSNVMRQSPVFSSNTTANIEVTNGVGENSAVNSAVVSNSSINSENDQTLSDLRKAIVGDFIKNPKTFKGNKDDVNKWIEDIEHLFNIAHISDSIRLDLISYSLRGDALEWFKNNRSLFTSWTTFVSELKRAFTSSFCGELAFKKLESYTQGENQSIRSFFNEVLKLCKEVDTTMSEATKLKTLLNKTKPSIQFEVRKKKPTSTSEFLEYAKEAEELLQLSNINTGNSTTDIHNANSVSQTSASSSAPVLPTRQSFENSNNNNTDRYTRRSDNNYQSSNFRSNYYQPNNSYSYSQYPRHPYPPNQNFSRRNQQGTNNKPANTSRSQFSSSQSQAKNNNYSRQGTVNAIDLPSSSEHSGSLEDAYPSNVCSQCYQFGHEASACPNF